MLVRRLVASTALGVAVLTGTAGAQQPVPIGDDFQINSASATALDNLATPSLVSMPDNSFVVVWDYENSYLGYVNFVRGRRYEANGDPVGGEFSVSEPEYYYDLSPDVAATQDGSFLVVWASDSENRARHYDSSGLPSGGPYSLSPDNGMHLAVGASETFVVAWQAFGDGSSQAIWARRLDPNGTPVASAFVVNTYTSGAQDFADVAVATGGSFVVTWRNSAQAPPDGRARWFDSSGLGLADEQLLDEMSPGVFGRPKVAFHGDRYLTVWDQDDADGDGLGIRARFWDQEGMPLGPSFVVNTYTTGAQRTAEVAATEDGQFLVVWISQEHDGQVGQLLSSTGAAIGEEFVVNSDTTASHNSHAVSAGPSSFIVAWANQDDGEDFDTIEGRRFAPATVFSDGFESGDTSTWTVTIPSPVL